MKESGMGLIAIAHARECPLCKVSLRKTSKCFIRTAFVIICVPSCSCKLFHNFNTVVFSALSRSLMHSTLLAIDIVL